MMTNSTKLTALLLILTILLAGCAATGLDNGASGTDGGSQGAASTSTTTPTETSDPIPSSTSQQTPVRAEIPGPEWSAPLSVEMQDTVEAAIGRMLGDERFKLVLEPELWADRYYGTYGECVVIFIEGQLTVITELVIGEQTITHGSSFTIYVYQNGEVRSLLDAYNDGWLKDEQISLIRQYHNAYNQAFRDWVNSQG